MSRAETAPNDDVETSEEEREELVKGDGEVGVLDGDVPTTTTIGVVDSLGDSFNVDSLNWNILRLRKYFQAMSQDKPFGSKE